MRSVSRRYDVGITSVRLVEGEEAGARGGVGVKVG